METPCPALKILHYIPTFVPAFQFGGPVQSVSRLARGLVTLGHQVDVITSTAGIAPEQSGKLTHSTPVEWENGVRIWYYPQENGIGIRAPGMEQAIQERAKDYDIVHLTGVWQRTSPAAAGACLKHNTPYIVSPRGALGPYSWRQKSLKKHLYYYLFERSILKGASGMHFTTKMEKRECETFLFDSIPCVIPNPIDLSHSSTVSPPSHSFLEQYPIDPDKPILLNAGRIHHKKGLDLLPPALAQIKDLEWQMLFAGAEEDRTASDLKKELLKLELENRAHFLPHLSSDQLCSLYRASRLFLLPSRHENFGNVVVEALACGCPTIISEQVGLSEDLRDCPLVTVLSRNPKAWADAIRQTLTRPSPSPESRKQTISAVKERFSEKIIAQQMLKFYKQVQQTH